MPDQDQLVQRLLQHAGTTYAREAGIRLRNKPMPLFQLLVLCMLASKPIGAAIAAGAARELFKTGLRTPSAVLAAERHTIIGAFDRAHYVRYDESSATRLADIAKATHERYRGDLRVLADRSGHAVPEAVRLLTGFAGIGDTGAHIYLREIQDVWVWVRPAFDDRALAAARELGLPADARRLGALSPGSNAALAAALTRFSLDPAIRARLTT
ncbi:MAG TPA: endonuclease [Mycobacterium sp.]|nr:endonuclease [Mycobacterium sp.]